MAEENVCLGSAFFPERIDMLSCEEMTEKNLEVTEHSSLRLSFNIMSWKKEA